MPDQRSLADQLRDLIPVANQMGMYDAADFLSQYVRLHDPAGDGQVRLTAWSGNQITPVVAVKVIREHCSIGLGEALEALRRVQSGKEFRCKCSADGINALTRAGFTVKAAGESE